MRAALCLSFAGVLCACSRPPGCTKDGDCKGDRVCADGTCRDPTAKGQPASVAPSATPAALPSRSVPEGWLSNDRHVPPFSIRRDEGDGGLAFAGAAGRCRARGLAPCTEAQLERACAVDPVTVDREVWASSFEGTGIVVRGPGCGARKTTHANDRSPARTVACCSRGVTLVTEVRAPGWVGVTGEKLLAFEGASTKGSAAIAPLLAPTVKVHALDVPALIVASKFDGLPPGAWSTFDVCKLSVQVKEDIWTAECSKLYGTSDKVNGVLTRLGWSGEAGVVVRYQDVQDSGVVLAL